MEDFVKFSLRLLFSSALLLAVIFLAKTNLFAQVESVVGQFTSTSASVFVRGVSGDGRFVVVESNGDLATEKTPSRNNFDGNFEIFLFDYGQRRIFQITNTTRALKDIVGSGVDNTNIQVNVVNTNPVISNDGRYIAFASNAYSTVPGNTSPANFDGNACTSAVATDCVLDANGNNPNRTTLTALRADGNLEIFLYQIPQVTPVNLSLGAELPLTDLAAGTFTQATSSPQSLPPLPGSSTQAPIVRPDNSLPSISDDGSVVSFVSNRDLVPQSGSDTNGNADLNREIFVYLKNAANKTHQVTKTTRGDIINQIYNINPSISGNGQRVAFASTAVNPVRGASGGANPDVNLHVFYANLDVNGEPVGADVERQVQITKSLRSSPDSTTDILSQGNRISRDGRYIAFESLSNSPGDAAGASQSGYAVFVYDAAPAATTRYKQYGARSLDDPNVTGNSGGCSISANGGDSCRYPSFTDNGVGGTPATLIFTSRINYRADGTVSTVSGGLNETTSRPPQFYSTPLDTSGTTATASVSLLRLTQIPTTTFSDVQPFASNTQQRIAFNLANNLGAPNPDGGYEGFYLISPINALTTGNGDVIRGFATGASARRVGTPTPIVTPTPTATPTPTPITPDAVTGLSTGALAIVRLNYTRPRNTIFAAGGGTTRRSFELPIELGGVTVNLSGAASGIYSVDYQRRQITIVLPKALGTGTFNVTVNDNGRLSRSTLNIVASQPDVFNKDPIPGPGGRARIINTTNPFPLLSEPFFIRTIRRRPYGNVQTQVRLFLTGVRGLAATDFNIRIGDQTITGAQILTGAVETEAPGIYTIDFLLPPGLNGEGDVPIIVTTTGGAASRLDDTAPRVLIL